MEKKKHLYADVRIGRLHLTASFNDYFTLIRLVQFTDTIDDEFLSYFRFDDDHMVLQSICIRIW